MAMTDTERLLKEDHDRRSNVIYKKKLALGIPDNTCKDGICNDWATNDKEATEEMELEEIARVHASGGVGR
jgi:hypothetical protein